MIDVIIADDERLIREGLSRSVDWRRLGCVLKGAASNGRVGLELIREMKPDLVITDIRMPVLSGLDMIREASRLERPPLFMVISGYDDFEYARTALEFGVRHFLLKPLDEEELEEKIKALSRELEGGSERGSSGNHLVDRITDYLDYSYHKREISLAWISENLIFKNAEYLGRLFRKHRGETFQSYLNAKRIDEARRLLRERPEIKVYEIAEACGFPPDGQYFSTQFKKTVGITPRQYARQARKETP